MRTRIAVLFGPFALLSSVVSSVVSSIWACAALFFDGPFGGALAAVFALASIGAFVWLRPLRKALLVYAALFAGVLAWWLSIEPSNDRNWLPDVSRPATAEIDGEIVTFRNVRNFEYRSVLDYDERWEDRRYDLSKLRGVDFFVIYWGSPWIAHTIVSWVFEEGPPLAISIETRKEVGEDYSAVKGFFRQFELYYVVADESDVIQLRTDHRGEDVYLYRLRTPKEVALKVLLAYIEEINRLATRPRWYNALRHNCTTSIRHNAQSVGAGNPLDWRILLNGRIDELGYERGSVDTSLPFAELKARSYITERAQRIPAGADFSAAIREGLPGAREPAPRGDSDPEGAT